VGKLGVVLIRFPELKLVKAVSKKVLDVLSGERLPVLVIDAALVSSLTAKLLAEEGSAK
jgi:hypothetical protein